MITPNNFSNLVETWPKILTLADIMRHLQASELAVYIRLLAEMKTQIGDGKVHVKQDWKSTIRYYMRLCKDYGLPVSADFARDLSIYLDVSRVLNGTSIKQDIERLQQATYSELSAITLLQLSPDEVRYLKAKDLFGAEVTARFPSAITDIEEAGRCFAFSRYTACAFHCMRAIEIGLKAIGQHLQVKRVHGHEWSWERVLSDILTAIQANRSKKPKPRFWRERDPFLTEAHAQLHAVRKAWRNPTMHCVNIYNEEQVLDIFNASRGFMRHIATKLDETGKWVGGR